MRGAGLATFALMTACSGAHAAYETEQNVAGYHVGFAVDPLVIGERNTAIVTLTQAGVPVEGAVVTLALSMPAMMMPETVVTLEPQNKGRYSGLVRFTMSGNWLARVAAQRAGTTGVRARFDLRARDR